MVNSHEKLLLIGIDQALTCLLDNFLIERESPAVQKLKENGIMGEAYS
jgi:hypothetical protein